MKNLIKRVTVLALCFTLIMSCVVEATPQDLQNMSGRDITAAFKAQKLKVRKATYDKNVYQDWLIESDYKEFVTFCSGKKWSNSDIYVMICEDSEDAINAFAHKMWEYGSDNSMYQRIRIRGSYEYFPKYEFYRRGNVIIQMNTKISKKVRNKYKKALKSIYNRPAEVAEQK